MSITSYSIASTNTNNPDDLAVKVGAAISDGWQPYGPPVVTNTLLYQVLIKGTPVGGGGGDYTLPAATTSALGGVKQAAVQANSTATDVAGAVADINALLTKLRAAGMVASA